MNIIPIPQSSSSSSSSSYKIKKLSIIIIYFLYLINFINCQFYATNLNNLPKTQGDFIDYHLFNIDLENIDKTATILFTSSGLKTYGIKESSSNSSDGSLIYKFQIPPGCGNENEILIEIGTNIFKTNLIYQSPIITNCTIIENDIVCYGDNFGSLKNTIIKYSNQTISSNSFSIFQDTNFKFQIKDSYYSDYININVCSISIETDYLITLNPILKSISIPNPFTLNNPIINLMVSYFPPPPNQYKVTINCNKTTSTDYEGETTSTNIECNLKSFTKTNYECKLPNYKFKSCWVIFNENEIQSNSIFKLNYSLPFIEKTNSIYFRDGGIISIVGSDFYQPINSILIGPANCTNIKFIDNSNLECELPKQEIPVNQIIDFNDYTTITISSDALIGYYNYFHYKEFNDNNQFQSEDHNPDAKLKWMIPVIIIPILLGLLTIFIPFFLCRKKSRLIFFNNCCMKNRDLSSPKLKHQKNNNGGAVTSKIPSGTTKSISDINLHSMHFTNLDE